MPSRCKLLEVINITTGSWIQYKAHYIYIIDTDTCEGGVVQYFLDNECTVYAGSSDLAPGTNNCSMANSTYGSGGMVAQYAEILCTTSSEPIIQNVSFTT